MMMTMMMLPVQESGWFQESCSQSPSNPFPCYLPPPCSTWSGQSNNYHHDKDRAENKNRAKTKTTNYCAPVQPGTSHGCRCWRLLYCRWLSWRRTWICQCELFNQYFFSAYVFICKDKISPLESAGMSWGLRLTCNDIRVIIQNLFFWCHSSTLFIPRVHHVHAIILNWIWVLPRVQHQVPLPASEPQSKRVAKALALEGTGRPEISSCCQRSIFCQTW